MKLRALIFVVSLASVTSVQAQVAPTPPPPNLRDLAKFRVEEHIHFGMFLMAKYQFSKVADKEYKIQIGEDAKTITFHIFDDEGKDVSDQIYEKGATKSINLQVHPGPMQWVMEHLHIGCRLDYDFSDPNLLRVKAFPSPARIVDPQSYEEFQIAKIGGEWKFFYGGRPFTHPFKVDARSNSMRISELPGDAKECQGSSNQQQQNPDSECDAQGLQSVYQRGNGKPVLTPATKQEPKTNVRSGP
jgi:hypothetical protein